MAFSSRTFSVFVCVMLASLAFLVQDALAARALLQYTTGPPNTGGGYGKYP
jgi:hypothetical protein